MYHWAITSNLDGQLQSILTHLLGDELDSIGRVPAQQTNVLSTQISLTGNKQSL